MAGQRSTDHAHPLDFARSYPPHAPTHDTLPVSQRQLKKRSRAAGGLRHRGWDSLVTATLPSPEASALLLRFMSVRETAITLKVVKS